MQDENYNLKGYHKVMTPSVLGDAYIIEYYADYNGGSPTGLKVKETRTYERNAITGIIETITITISSTMVFIFSIFIFIYNNT